MSEPTEADVRAILKANERLEGKSPRTLAIVEARPLLGLCFSWLTLHAHLGNLLAVIHGGHRQAEVAKAVEEAAAAKWQALREENACLRAIAEDACAILLRTAGDYSAYCDGCDSGGAREAEIKHASDCPVRRLAEMKEKHHAP